MLASRHGHLDVVKELLEKGAKVEAHSSVSNTALMLAAYSGHVEVVNELLKAGANPEDKNVQRLTARQLAKQRGHKDVVKIFDALERGKRSASRSTVSSTASTSSK